jgi:trans-aconitate 2-methyltransferase
MRVNAVPAAAWNPKQYGKFEDERNRPAVELLSRVLVEQPQHIVDIGCGPGNSTELLRARYPDAEVIGLDSSPDMLAAARKRLPDVMFIEADVARWSPEEPVDVLFANATFQWVPGHQALLVRLARSLAPGGVLAFQVPDNLGEPTHQLMRDVAREGRWHEKFREPIEREEIPVPAAYYDLLKPVSATVDIWTTIYNHVLAGPGAVLDWVAGTGLRPYLARLDDSERGDYLADYTGRLGLAYPARVDGKVLLRFPRLFVVATRA